MNRLILLVTLSLGLAACGNPGQLNTRVDRDGALVVASTQHGQVCLAASKWVCHNPGSPLHGTECSDACVERGDSATFCWELTAEDCVDRDQDWATDHCPLLERTCVLDEEVEEAQDDAPFEALAEAVSDRTIDGPVTDELATLE